MSIRSAGIALLLAALSLTSSIAVEASVPFRAQLPRCSKDSEKSNRKGCRKPWTVLVYMATSPDLLPYAYWDLYEMEAGYARGRQAAASTVRSDLLVQLNAPGDSVGRRFHMIQSARAFNAQLGLEHFKLSDWRSIESPLQMTESLSDNPGSADDLTRFLEWGIQEYPSDHVLVVLWGHGQGWAGMTQLGIPTLHDVLRRVSETHLNGQRIDLYASDACLMQSIEVAYEFSDVARFVVGPAQIQNELGFPYRRLMFELNTGRFAGERTLPAIRSGEVQNDEAYLLARMLPRLQRLSLEKRGLHGRHFPHAVGSSSLSAVASDELRWTLMPALQALGRSLNQRLQNDPSQSISLQGHIRSSPSVWGGARDLAHFLKELQNNSESPELGELRQRAAAALSALNRAVVSEEKDLTLWLPASKKDYDSRTPNFAISRFWLDLGKDWAEWLRRLFYVESPPQTLGALKL